MDHPIIALQLLPSLYMETLLILSLGLYSQVQCKHIQYFLLVHAKMVKPIALQHLPFLYCTGTVQVYANALGL
jgi:hypothetical protein